MSVIFGGNGVFVEIVGVTEEVDGGNNVVENVGVAVEIDGENGVVDEKKGVSVEFVVSFFGAKNGSARSGEIAVPIENVRCSA